MEALPAIGKTVHTGDARTDLTFMLSLRAVSGDCVDKSPGFQEVVGR